MWIECGYNFDYVEDAFDSIYEKICTTILQTN